MRRHPSRAVLRQIQDEPQAVPEQARAHVASCPGCEHRIQAMAATAAVAEAALRTTGPAPDPYPALRTLRAGEPTAIPAKPARSIRLRTGLLHPRALRLGAVGVTVAVLLGTLVASGAAGSLIKIFEPDSFVAVPIDFTSLGNLPDLAGFGSTHLIQAPSVTFTASAAQAKADSGLALLTPGPLPSAVKGSPSYVVLGAGSASFTFSTSAAAATAARLGRPLPTLPPGLEGAVLTLNGGPLVVEMVGSQSLGAFAEAAGTHSPGSPPSPGGTASPSGPRGLLGSGLLSGGLPQLVIVQMKAPVLYSDKLTVTQYEDALLSMPGVPPSLAAQFRSLGDLSSTLPIPIPRSLADAHSADINGAPGLVIGDTTGIASGVIWQRNGLVYGVAGSLTDAQVVAIARSMH